MTLPRSIVLAAVLLAWLPASAVDFNRDVRPILSDKCFSCHGPDSHDRKADLRVDTAEGAFADLGGYAAFVPKKPEESEAWFRITSEDPDEIMPPAKIHKPMSAEEKAIIREWIEEGAPYELHWSFQALERPEVPEVKSDWSRNEIDSFVLAAQQRRGLSPSPKADPATLARRLHLDLLGLPPEPEVVAKFVRDPSPEAYSKLVADLLNNPAYGERMAVYWMDLVRYADTIGYHSDNPMEVSAYRDYVIDAFNQNMPYDQFTIEQLAGDLLPEPTLQQRIASGYNRLLQTTQEGGAQAKEYVAIHAADRVRNVSGVWLATTIGCAQCHDHKYDPFSAKDFYSLAAFFADVKEKPIGARVPNLKLPTPEEASRMEELRQAMRENAIPKLLERDPELARQLAAAQTAWEADTLAKIEQDAKSWSPIAPGRVKSSGGSKLEVQPDGSVLATGRVAAKSNYTVELKAEGKVTGIRLEALTHDSLNKKSLSRGNGNFILTSILVNVDGQPVKIASAKADFEQNGWPIAGVLDQDKKTGWAVNGHNEAVDRSAIFLFEEPLELTKKQILNVELRHESEHTKHNIGRFRLSVTDQLDPPFGGGVDLPLPVRDSLLVSREERSEEETTILTRHYRGIAPELAEARKQLETWKAELESIDKGVQTMLVSEPLEEPRMMKVLPRGNWLDDSGEVVEPAVPVFLPHKKIEGRRANRLDLAHWIMDDTNPLTARAYVNRLWKLFHGEGLSRNLDDLGGQGVPPSHPELLDWLAVEFRESGWDVNHMVRLMLESATYQQSSVESLALRQADPGNEWLTRQGRWRLEGEFIRDVALDVSGLLVMEQGGRSVKPYQPEGYWQHLNFPKRSWKADTGESLYRRGLYTFWCRSFLHPAMLAFDAPSREECTASRARSNTPQQALVLLNDPVFVEASRVFAQRILEQKGDPTAQVSWAWEEALSRQPTKTEVEILTGVLEEQHARYSADPEAAAALIEIGEWPVPENQDAAELAAWTQVARTILNAYETTSRN